MSSGDKHLLRIGSRESPLALVQAYQVRDDLARRWPQLVLQVHTFKTRGDIVLDTSLSKVGDKGLFVKELEQALLAGEIDIAVHSLKDLPGALPEGLGLQSAGEREDPRDVLISPQGLALEELPAGAVVGTSSLRRVAQLQRLRRDLAYENIRGNLHTRYRKLQEGPYQAMILAAAGVHRLEWRERVTQYFDPFTQCIPAVGQGILGLEFRTDDAWTQEKIAPLRHPAVETALQAERAVLKTLEGGCQVPLAAYASPDGDGFRLMAAIFNLDGTRARVEEARFEPGDAEAAGAELARRLLDDEGRALWAEVRPHH